MELEQSQILLNSIINSTDDMIWSVDPVDFGFMMFNRGLSDHYLDKRGIKLKMGMRPADLYPTEELVQLWRGFYRKALVEGSFTSEYVTFSGTDTLQLTINTLQQDGKVIGLAAFGKNITAQKQAETHNRIIAEVQNILLRPCKLEDIYRLVSEKVKELVGDGITATSILDEKAKTLRMGAYHGKIPLERMLAAFGSDPRKKEFSLGEMTEEDLRIYRSGKLEIIEGGLYTLMGSLAPKSAFSILEKIMRVKKIYAMGFIHKNEHLGGLFILARSDITPHIAAIEQIVNLAAIAIERTRAEEAERESEKLLSLFIQQSPIYTYIKSVTPTESRILVASENFQEMVGIRGADMVGKTMEELFPAEFAAKMTADDWAVVSGDQILKVDEDLNGRTYTTIKFPITQAGKQLLAGYTIDITARKQAEEALRFSEQTAHRTAEQLRMIHQISEKIAAGLDFERLMQTIYEQCQQFGDTDIFYIALYDDATGIISFPFNYGDGERRVFTSHNIKENPGVTGRIIESRQTLYLSDESNLPAGILPVRQTGPQSRSFVGVPLISSDRVIGVLSMQSFSANAYSSEQIQTLDLLASQVAIAIQNSQLYTQVQDERNLANALIDYLPGVVLLLNQQGCLVRWNDYAGSITGYTTEDFGKLGFLSVFPFEEQARLAGLIARILAGEQVTTSTYVITKKSDQKIFFDVVSTRVQIGNEAFALIMGIDTTERMKAVAALQESEENYRGAITAAGLVPYVDDYETHQYSFMGENIFKITGYLAEEMTPAIFNAMIQENHTNELDDANLGPEEAAKRFLSGKVGKWSNDIRICTRSGEERWLNDVSVPRVDEHGRATKAIGVIQDVTERKQAEALRIAAQAADATNEARSEFLTSMSHELRTPLNAIIGFSDMLEQQFYGPLNAKQAEYVQDINDSGQYLLSLINAILDLSKIEAGKMELDLSEVYLREILEQGLLMIREAANAHGLRVSLSVPPEVDELVIKADALKLKQIMFNLLSNAAKFTPDYGAIDITAWLAGGETESEPRRVEICVTDSGIGLEPGDLTRVFESFFQVKSAKRGKPQGTGLGLSLVKHMVELHGGKVWAESGGPGKGCRFIFTLPLAGNL